MCCIKFNQKKILHRMVIRGNKKINFHFIGPECRECISWGLFNLSLRSRYLRFLMPRYEN